MQRLLILSLILFNTTLFGQVFQYSGYVIDVESGKEIVNPQIYQGGSISNIQTDSRGYFSFTSNMSEEELCVSHLGYHQKCFTIKFQNNAHRLEMDPRETLIPTVEIRKETDRPLFPNPKTYIIDYEPLLDSFLYIIYLPERKKNVLVVADKSGRVILDTLDTPESPGQFFTDCFGNLHIISNQYISQLILRSGSPLFFKRDKSSYLSKISQCLEAKDSLIFLEDLMNKQTREYYATNIFSFEKTPLLVLQNFEKLKQMAEEGLIYNRESSISDYLSSPMNYSPRQMVNIQFYEKVLFKELPSDLISVNNKIIIGDFDQNRCFRFASLWESPSVIPFSLPEKRGWVYEFQPDPITDKIYLIREKSGYSQLYEFDPEEGMVYRKVEIPHPWASNIKVYNGKLFYLFKENNYDDINRVYAINID